LKHRNFLTVLIVCGLALISILLRSILLSFLDPGSESSTVSDRTASITTGVIFVGKSISAGRGISSPLGDSDCVIILDVYYFD
jgi:hypothetical protein